MQEAFFVFRVFEYIFKICYDTLYVIKPEGKNYIYHGSGHDAADKIQYGALFFSDTKDQWKNSIKNNNGSEVWHAKYGKRYKKTWKNLFSFLIIVIIAGHDQKGQDHEAHAKIIVAGA